MASDSAQPLKLCHGGLLLGKECHIESGSWRRVCQQCVAHGDLTVPEAHCRLLTQNLGRFSAGRTFYVQWTYNQRVVSERVRPFTIAGTSTVLLIFPSAQDVTVCESAVPAGLLMPAPIEHRKLRLCCTSKSLCPLINFHGASGSAAASSCTVHLRSQVGAAVRAPTLTLAPEGPTLTLHPTDLTLTLTLSTSPSPSPSPSP